MAGLFRDAFGNDSKILSTHKATLMHNYKVTCITHHALLLEISYFVTIASFLFVC